MIKLREQLAAYAHESWSGWMKWMFEQGGYGTIQAVGDESNELTFWTMKPEKYERWQRQSSTLYADLPESEKASDRVEADKMLTILQEYTRDFLRCHIESFEDEILDVIADFGDTPTQCLQIISERIELARHYRAHPNAPKVEEPI